MIVSLQPAPSIYLPRPRQCLLPIPLTIFSFKKENQLYALPLLSSFVYTPPRFQAHSRMLSYLKFIVKKIVRPIIN